MAAKHWIPEALRSLAESLAPVPHEINEIDWKARLSDNSARLAEHLMAFANHPGGGTLVFGVDDDGVAHGIAAEEVATRSSLVVAMYCWFACQSSLSSRCTAGASRLKRRGFALVALRARLRAKRLAL